MRTSSAHVKTMAAGEKRRFPPGLGTNSVLMRPWGNSSPHAGTGGSSHFSNFATSRTGERACFSFLRVHSHFCNRMYDANDDPSLNQQAAIAIHNRKHFSFDRLPLPASTEEKRDERTRRSLAVGRKIPDRQARLASGLLKQAPEPQAFVRP